MKYTNRNKKIVLISWTTILFISIILIERLDYISDNQINSLNYYYYGIFNILIIDCLIISKLYHIKYTQTGLRLLLIPFLWDYLTLLMGIEINYNANLIQISRFNFILVGMILILIGIGKMYRGHAKSHRLYDHLTELPNVNYLTHVCALKNNKPCDRTSCLGIHPKNQPKAMLCIDIDNFKYYNETLGLETGDQMIKAVAERIRKMAPKTSVVARLYGDAFLIFTDYNDLNELDLKIEAFFKGLKAPYFIKGSEYHLTFSIGISLYPINERCLERLINQAEMTVNYAKTLGMNQYAYYNASLGDYTNNRFEVVNELRLALKNHEFVLYYQPKADVTTGNVTGFEALIRWNHPTRGLVFPDQFIHIAEQNGMIKEIDTLVLEMACQQIKKWGLEGTQIYNISINVSSLFFNDVNFISILDSMIDKYLFNPKYLSLEITETVAINDFKRTKALIDEIRNRNIKIYIDDFGKGFSSLNYLKELPIDILKIDKSFIDEITHDKKVEAIIELIVQISKVFNFVVVSEGIEDVKQLEFLKQIGCNEYQGYYLSKPKPIHEFQNLK